MLKTAQPCSGDPLFHARPGGDIIFPTAVPDPQYILYPSDFNYFIIILGISSDGINAIVTHFIIAKKKPARGFELTPREQAV